MAAAAPWIAGIVAAWAANKWGGNSGGTPNQYPVQLTPEQRQAWNEIWRVYKDGGSDIQKGIQGAAIQFINNTPTTAPGFKFVSPLLQGQPFAGGVEIPKVTINYDPNAPRPVTPPKQTSRPYKPITNPEPSEAPMSSVFASGNIPASQTEQPTPTPQNTAVGPESGSFTQPATRQPLPQLSERVRNAWSDYKQRNPNWKRNSPQTAISEMSRLTGAQPEEIAPVIRSDIMSIAFGSQNAPNTGNAFAGMISGGPR